MFPMISYDFPMITPHADLRPRNRPTPNLNPSGCLQATAEERRRVTTESKDFLGAVWGSNGAPIKGFFPNLLMFLGNLKDEKCNPSLVNYELIISLNWLINTLELLLPWAISYYTFNY